MNDPFLYPRFSLAERDRRWKAIREKMRAQKLDVIVVPNNTGHSTDFQSNARYVSHVGGGGDADVAVVFPLEGDVTAIATSCNPRWQPNVQQWTTDVREARRRYGRPFLRWGRLDRMVVKRGVGVVAERCTGNGPCRLGFCRNKRMGAVGLGFNGSVWCNRTRPTSPVAPSTYQGPESPRIIAEFGGRLGGTSA